MVTSAKAKTHREMDAVVVSVNDSTWCPKLQNIRQIVCKLPEQMHYTGKHPSKRIIYTSRGRSSNASVQSTRQRRSFSSEPRRYESNRTSRRTVVVYTTIEANTRALGSRGIDISHDWKPHVGCYPVLEDDKTWWDYFSGGTTTHLEVTSQP
jgi:hypothetical protein